MAEVPASAEGSGFGLEGLNGAVSGVSLTRGRSVADLFQDRLPNLGSGRGDAEVRYIAPKGLRKTFRVMVSVLNVNEPGGLGFVYTFDDLTEIRRLEREVRLRDRLAAVGRMAAGIAHEIRNPLTSMAGSVKMLASMSALTGLGTRS